LKLRASLAWGDLIDELNALPAARRVPADHLPHVFVAEIAGQIVGYAAVLPRDDGEAELDDLFVAPETWRRGVGVQLMAEAERRAAALGGRALHVISHPRARAFYEACGFQLAGEVTTKLGPAPELWKTLG
jgi:GNAT superfamily N-acetyltransferase